MWWYTYSNILRGEYWRPEYWRRNHAVFFALRMYGGHRQCHRRVNHEKCGCWVSGGFRIQIHQNDEQFLHGGQTVRTPSAKGVCVHRGLRISQARGERERASGTDGLRRSITPPQLEKGRKKQASFKGELEPVLGPSCACSLRPGGAVGASFRRRRFSLFCQILTRSSRGGHQRARVTLTEREEKIGNDARRQRMYPAGEVAWSIASTYPWDGSGGIVAFGGKPTRCTRKTRRGAAAAAAWLGGRTTKSLARLRA